MQRAQVVVRQGLFTKAEVLQDGVVLSDTNRQWGKTVAVFVDRDFAPPAMSPPTVPTITLPGSQGVIPIRGAARRDAATFRLPVTVVAPDHVALRRVMDDIGRLFAYPNLSITGVGYDVVQCVVTSSSVEHIPAPSKCMATITYELLIPGGVS